MPVKKRYCPESRMIVRDVQLSRAVAPIVIRYGVFGLRPFSWNAPLALATADRRSSGLGPSSTIVAPGTMFPLVSVTVPLIYALDGSTMEEGCVFWRALSFSRVSGRLCP